MTLPSGTWVAGTSAALDVAHRVERAALILEKNLAVLDVRAAKEAWQLGKEARRVAAVFRVWSEADTVVDVNLRNSLNKRLLEISTAVEAFLAIHDRHPTVRLRAQ